MKADAISGFGGTCDMDNTAESQTPDRDTWQKTSTAEGVTASPYKVNFCNKMLTVADPRQTLV